MTAWPKCARFLLVLTGLMFALSSAQSAVAAGTHGLSDKVMQGMTAKADVPPCHKAPAKSEQAKPDCCASGFVCFSKCNSAAATFMSPGMEPPVSMIKVGFEAAAWVGLNPQPPTHPPSA